MFTAFKGPTDNRKIRHHFSTALKVLLGCLFVFGVYVAFLLMLHLFVADQPLDAFLRDLPFQLNEPRPPPEEKIRFEESISILWDEYNRRSQVKDYFVVPDWWYLDEDGNDTGYIYGPYKRAEILTSSTQVTCWPSNGGFWTTWVGPVVLDYLGLDRLRNTPRSNNSTEEDEFCSELQKFGPTWYESETWYRYSVRGDTEILGCVYPEQCPPPTALKPPIFYGYPTTGGLWVLELVNRRELDRSGMGRLNNVFTMDEKSKVIEMLSGKFYSTADDYWSAQEKQSLIPHEFGHEELYSIMFPPD